MRERRNNVTYEWVQCPACKGTGKTANGDKDCALCEGVGEVLVPKEERPQ